MSDSLRIELRAEAGPAIGLGHAMRSLALGQALIAAGHQVSWKSSHLPGSLPQRLEKLGIAWSAESAAVDAVVFDGYHFTPAESAACPVPVLTVDDAAPPLADRHPQAAVVLNPNLHAADAIPPRSTGRWLLGPRFALLRPEFLGVQAGPISTVQRVIVTLGGADPDGRTAATVAAVRQALPTAEIQVIAGAANPRLAQLRRDCSALDAQVLVDVADMATTLAAADLVVAAAGSTVLELLALGVPCIAMAIADNQGPVARRLARDDLAEVVDDEAGLTKAVAELAADLELRRSRSVRGQRLVDGHGAARVVSALEAAVTGLGLRPADADDALSTLDWANDPITRAASFGRSEISTDDHHRWFTAKLNDATQRMWIAEDADGIPSGVIRCDLPEHHDGPALIHLTLAASHRGRGLAAKAIAAACRRMTAGHLAATIHALIMPDNPASLRAFSRAGFVPAGTTTVRGHSAQILRWAVK